jgi:hypothetical protein
MRGVAASVWIGSLGIRGDFICRVVLIGERKVYLVNYSASDIDVQAMHRDNHQTNFV